jgi:membrane associated rhomboid family serine protease
MESENYSDVWLSPMRARCADLALVLASQGIPSQIRQDEDSWVLSVPAEAEPLARMEIAAYSAESRLAARPEPVRELPAGSPWPALGAYALLLLTFELAQSGLWLGIDWLTAGRVDGRRMFAGEWWRAVTALTLHADLGHLLGNLAFGAFFGYSVARYVGAGCGWLAIVLCGALGNCINVLLMGAEHRAIGASTAVFAALGILSAYCWRRGFPPRASRRERFAPVVAGLGLLAFTGTGGVNTDLGAHLFGFVAGFGGGLVFARFGFARTALVQRACGVLALAVIAAAWLAAVA